MLRRLKFSSRLAAPLVVMLPLLSCLPYQHRAPRNADQFAFRRAMVLLRGGCACGGVAEVPKLGCLVKGMSACEVKADPALLMPKLRLLTQSGHPTYWRTNMHLPWLWLLR